MFDRSILSNLRIIAKFLPSTALNAHTDYTTYLVDTKKKDT